MFQSTASAAAVAAMLCVPALAQAQTRNFDVAAQPASSGIQEFARQAGIRIIATAADTRERRTNAVQGSLDTRTAMERLLSGTGLSVRSFDGSTAVLSAADGRSEADAEVETLVVTGSRIARPELDSSMPVSVVSFDAAKDFGRFTAYDALKQVPAVAPGLGEWSSRSQAYDKGVANINLRNMGANRSLVVVDGHRWVSGGARTMAVDLNTIPSALIERFEVVTGGAAAIYGADAVTGAVNVIMKKQMDGVSASATAGVSEDGDAEQYQFSAATGFKFAGDRARVVIGGNYIYTSPVLATDRYPKNWAYQVNPDNTGPNDGIPDNIIVDTKQFYRSNYSTFCLFDRQGCGTTRNGDWYQLINGQVVQIPRDSYRVITTGELGTQAGGPDTAFGTLTNITIRDESKEASAYANLSYDLTPDVVWNTSFGLAQSWVSGSSSWPHYRDDFRPTNWWGINPTTGAGHSGEIARLTDPFLPESLRQFMVANGLTSIPLNRQYTNLPIQQEIHDRTAFTLGSDIGGPLTGRLNWQAFARYGQVKDEVRYTNMLGKREWLYGRDAIMLDGQVVCADAGARAAGCVPFDFYTTDAPSQAWVDYAMYDRHERTKNRMLNAGVGVDGSLFTLPAGEVLVAAGLEWRQEKLSTRDDPDAAKLSNIIWAPGMDHSVHPSMDATRNVSEAYAELVVPVLSDVPFAHKLTVEGAYRYSHYNDNPSTDTWKVGFNWAPIAGLTVRGAKSYSVRVPNFGELFSPVGVQNLGNISDPCEARLITQDKDRAANCAATVPGWTGPLPDANLNAPRIFTGGNPNLTPETGDTHSFGVVLQPSFVPGFDLTVDYWAIDIENVVTSIAYTTIMNNCVDASGGPDMGYCRFVHRHATSGPGHLAGQVDYVEAQFANLAARRSRGIDYSANYRVPVGDGTLRLSFMGSQLLEQTTVAQSGGAGSDAAGQWNNPKFKGTLTAGYEIGRFRLGVNTTYTSASRFNINDQSDETRERSEVPAYFNHNLSLTFSPTDQYSVQFGVRNFTNNRIDHPVLQWTYAGPNQTEGNAQGVAFMDAVGRYFYLTLKADF